MVDPKSMQANKNRQRQSCPNTLASRSYLTKHVSRVMFTILTRDCNGFLVFLWFLASLLFNICTNMNVFFLRNITLPFLDIAHETLSWEDFTIVSIAAYELLSHQYLIYFENNGSMNLSWCWWQPFSTFVLNQIIWNKTLKAIKSYDKESNEIAWIVEGTLKIKKDQIHN